MAPGAISPPPAAIESYNTFKPQGILKRKRTQDVDLSSPAVKPSVKRQRVAFEPDVTLKFSDEAGGKDVALIRDEILKAIKTRDSGGRERLAEIQSYFTAPLDSDDAPSSIAVRKHILGLTSNANILNQVSDLVNSVIHHTWLGRDDVFVAVYTRFLGHLVSSQGGYLSSVLKMLVGNLAHLSTSLARPVATQIPEASKLYARIHAALRTVLSVVPAASSTLLAVLGRSFPPPHDTERAHVQYVRNIFKIIQYAPELRSGLLELVTERLIKIDVLVQDDVEDLEEDVVDLLDRKPVSSMGWNVDNDDPLTDDESDFSDDEDLDEENQRLKDLRCTVEKLDSLLDLLFAYHSENFAKGPGSLDAISSFDELLSQFRKIVLPTFRSRHTQFLLFHFAQKSPEFTSRFTDLCMKTLTDRSRSSFMRSSAAAYLASFVARGSRVSSDVVVHVCEQLSTFADKLRREQLPSCRGPDLRRHDVYYATMQAILYIFCFRWRDLLIRSGGDYDEDDEDVELDDEELLASDRPLIWAPGLKELLYVNFHCLLNPLRVCSPGIVEEFARIAYHTRFMYIHSILEHNSRVRLHQAVPTGGASSRENSLTHLTGDRHLQLDAYFPFDPYLLPTSQRWLEGDYNVWKGVPGMGDEAQATAGRGEYDTGALSSSEDDSDDGRADEDKDDELAAQLDIDQRTATPVDGVDL